MEEYVNRLAKISLTIVIIVLLGLIVFAGLLYICEDILGKTPHIYFTQYKK